MALWLKVRSTASNSDSVTVRPPASARRGSRTHTILVQTKLYQAPRGMLCGSVRDRTGGLGRPLVPGSSLRYAEGVGVGLAVELAAGGTKFTNFGPPRRNRGALFRRRRRRRRRRRIYVVPRGVDEPR